MEDVEKHSVAPGAETHGAQNGTGVELQPYTNQLLKLLSHGKRNGLAVSLKKPPRKLSKKL